MGLQRSEAVFIWEHWNNYKLDRQKATQNWKLGVYLGDQRQSLSFLHFYYQNRVISYEVQEKDGKNCKNDLYPGLLKSGDLNQYA